MERWLSGGILFLKNKNTTIGSIVCPNASAEVPTAGSQNPSVSGEGASRQVTEVKAPIQWDCVLLRTGDWATGCAQMAG